MKVELLAHTPDPLRRIYVRTRGTTTSKGFAAVEHDYIRFFPKAVRAELDAAATLGEREAIAEREMTRLVLEAIEAGHLSVTRGVHFEFSFEVSRSTGRQMLRQVVGVAWEEMSQRYVKLLTDEYLRSLQWQYHAAFSETEYTPEEVVTARCELRDRLQKVFEVPEHILARVDDDKDFLFSTWAFVRKHEVEAYVEEIAAGVPAEDARENLPNCTKTQMVGTFSFEALKNFLAKRLCDRAQAPIRDVAKAMRREVLKVAPWAAPVLVIQCIPSGVCPETNPGGCPLLFDHGGRILRPEQAAEALEQYRRANRGNK